MFVTPVRLDLGWQRLDALVVRSEERRSPWPRFTKGAQALTDRAGAGRYVIDALRPMLKMPVGGLGPILLPARIVPILSAGLIRLRDGRLGMCDCLWQLCPDSIVGRGRASGRLRVIQGCNEDDASAHIPNEGRDHEAREILLPGEYPA